MATASIWSSASALNVVNAIMVVGQNVGTVQIVPSGTVTGGVITFEQSPDGVNWSALNMDNQGAAGQATSAAATANSSWQVGISAYQIRARLSTAVAGSGSVLVTAGSSNSGGGGSSPTGALLAANDLSDVASAATSLANIGGAGLASAAFTGTPTAPTATPGTNTTQLATTAFVEAAGASGVSSFNTRTGAVVPASGDYTVAEVTGAAPLASPALTGPSSDTDTTTTVGNVFTVSASAITSGNILNIVQTTSVMTGNAISVNVALGSTGKLLNLMVNSVSVATVGIAGGLALASSVSTTAVILSNAAGATTQAPRLNQVTAYLTITSGALPTITAASLATGTQVSTTRQTAIYIPVTLSPTVAAAATVAVAISPDNVTYTTVGTQTYPLGVAITGIVDVLSFIVPQGWYIKVTPNAQASVGTATYA